ncbi:MAG TPA: type II 3-dehydroquinate dehydratase [Opitutales bacterium]|nr:type II 3-dehydroquinate dehydratase [Opitutales bacterium]
MKTLGLLHGPNLDRLGKRETAIYGQATLADLEASVGAEAKKLGVKLECFQSNHEGALLEQIARWADAGVAGIIVNAGALTHTSVALRDAIAGCNLPCVEVHISNIYKREEFRHKSYTADVCVGVVSGLGQEGYFAALRFLAALKR